MKIKLSRTARRLSVLIGILATMIASGCATPDTARLVARTAKVADYTVTIIFENGCPKEANPPSQPLCTLPPDNSLCVNPGKAVEWVSDPVTPFVVYLSPFVGRPYASHGPDETTSPIIVRSDSMEGVYKYSVLGLACKDKDAAVLDPPLRVEY